MGVLGIKGNTTFSCFRQEASKGICKKYRGRYEVKYGRTPCIV